MLINRTSRQIYVIDRWVSGKPDTLYLFSQSMEIWTIWRRRNPDGIIYHWLDNEGVSWVLFLLSKERYDKYLNMDGVEGVDIDIKG